MHLQNFVEVNEKQLQTNVTVEEYVASLRKLETRQLGASSDVDDGDSSDKYDDQESDVSSEAGGDVDDYDSDAGYVDSDNDGDMRVERDESDVESDGGTLDDEPPPTFLPEFACDASDSDDDMEQPQTGQPLDNPQQAQTGQPLDNPQQPQGQCNIVLQPAATTLECQQQDHRMVATSHVHAGTTGPSAGSAPMAATDDEDEDPVRKKRVRGRVVIEDDDDDHPQPH